MAIINCYKSQAVELSWFRRFEQYVSQSLYRAAIKLSGFLNGVKFLGIKYHKTLHDNSFATTQNIDDPFFERTRENLHVIPM